MAFQKGNKEQAKRKKPGRGGFYHEKIVKLAYDIVDKELRGKCDKEITRKDKFNASLELVKKALPNNIKFDDDQLKILFDGVFASASKTKGDNS